jgi:hypothetical protein
LLFELYAGSRRVQRGDETAARPPVPDIQA